MIGARARGPVPSQPRPPERRARSPRSAPARRRRLDPAWLFAAVTVGLALGVVGLRVVRERGDLGTLPLPRVVPVPRVVQALTKPRVMRTVYLNREGATLHPGADDSHVNRSSIVKSVGDVPIAYASFAGTPKRWQSIVQCVRDKFAPYDVEVVDQRPVEGDYIMAMVGGRPQDLGAAEGAHAGDEHGHSHATGLAPFNGEAIADAIVFVFSRTLREETRATCETAAMEIAHAYGLDHARSCKDLMTYMRPCGARSFTDQAIPCGEHEERPCKGGAPTQNSHRSLLTALGPRGAHATE
jgi:hypothetical protein